MRGQKGKGSLLTVTILNRSILIGIIIFVGACHNSEKERLPSTELFGKIIYETAIVNHDSTDSWAGECLSDFNRNALIDKVFKSVYDRRVTPIDYYTGEKLSPDQIRKMETGGEFSRENISKIQFEERWIWDETKNEMQKQILSMTIAYEVFDHEFKPRGQKPIFRLIFRK